MIANPRVNTEDAVYTTADFRPSGMFLILLIILYINVEHPP